MFIEIPATKDAVGATPVGGKAHNPLLLARSTIRDLPEGKEKEALLANLRLTDLRKLASERRDDPEFDWRKLAKYISNEMLLLPAGRYRSTGFKRPWTWPAPNVESVLFGSRHAIFEVGERPSDPILSAVLAGIEDALRKAKGKRVHYTPHDIGRGLRLTAVERHRLKTWQIGACDRTDAELRDEAYARKAARKRERRHAAGATPRAQSISALKPWVLLRESRARFYRRPKVERDLLVAGLRSTGTTDLANVTSSAPRADSLSKTRPWETAGMSRASWYRHRTAANAHGEAETAWTNSAPLHSSLLVPELSTDRLTPTQIGPEGMGASSGASRRQQSSGIETAEGLGEEVAVADGAREPTEAPGLTHPAAAPALADAAEPGRPASLGELDLGSGYRETPGVARDREAVERSAPDAVWRAALGRAPAIGVTAAGRSISQREIGPVAQTVGRLAGDRPNRPWSIRFLPEDGRAAGTRRERQML